MLIPLPARAPPLALDAPRPGRGADGLARGRPALAQVDGEDPHRADREQLRLPVLQRPLPEVRARQVLAPGDRALPMLGLLLVEDDADRDRLADPRRQP